MAQEKMQIIAYSDNTLNSETGKYTFAVNPKPFKQEYKILYKKPEVKGSSAANLKFDKVAPRKMTFEFLFDATGAIGKSDPVDDQIDDFMKICYTYNGDIHSPNYLKLLWGTFSFPCRLTCANADYTFFKSDGTPLRAIVKATFTEFTDAKTIAKKQGDNSPDLTHVRIVKQGDNLPLMCHRSYGDSTYYLKIAEFNQLADMRDLTPGQKIYFPPIK